MEKLKVYEAINSIQNELSKIGISKDRKNQQQGYAFRGIDDVYNELSGLLSKYNLCILPRVFSRDCVERTSAKGAALFYTTVGVEFDFVSSVDGSKHTVITYGEAMDSADKATNKAMSAAYKYACIQAFCIPTKSEEDSDATTHEPAPKKDAYLERFIQLTNDRPDQQQLVDQFKTMSREQQVTFANEIKSQTIKETKPTVEV